LTFFLNLFFCFPNIAINCRITLITNFPQGWHYGNVMMGQPGHAGNHKSNDLQESLGHGHHVAGFVRCMNEQVKDG
jgi:hypothetical protein